MSETVYDSEAARLRPGSTATVTRDETFRRLGATTSSGRDAVRWGPIFAGFLTALGTFVLLSLLLLGLGASAVRVGSADAEDAARGIGAATAIAGLVAFLFGGFIAARTAAIRETWASVLNGFLVWGLGLLLILLLSAFGIGQLFGEAGTLITRFGTLGDLPDGADPAEVARAIRDAAIPAFLSLLLPAVAAALGGFIGSHEDLGLDIRRSRRSTTETRRVDANVDASR